MTSPGTVMFVSVPLTGLNIVLFTEPASSSEHAVITALRTQQVIAHESGLADVPDPFGGSEYLERRTNEIEREAMTIVERIDAFKASYPTHLDFRYRFKAHDKPFFVTAIYTDGTFTYITADAPELPALYEVRDGAPNLVNFQVEHGVYIVPKVVEQGYLSIGKQTLAFQRLGR